MLTGLVFFLGNSISSGIPIVLEALDLYHVSTDSPHLAFASFVKISSLLEGTISNSDLPFLA